MDPSSFDRIPRDIATRSSRRGLGGLAVGAIASLALSHDMQGKKKKKKGKGQKQSKNPPQSPPPPSPPGAAPGPPPPPPGLPVIPGPKCDGGASGTFGGSRRVAQAFTADRTGALVSATCMLESSFNDIIVVGAVYTLEIRALDGLGVPTNTVLASVDIELAAPGNHYALSATFPVPVQVKAGTGYAFTITTAEPGRMSLRVGNNACPGQLYSDIQANGNFVPAGTSDLLFTTTMIL